MLRSGSDRCCDPVTGTHGDRALVHHDLVSVHELSDFSSHTEYMLEVAAPSSPGGVPTAMKMMSAFRTANAMSVVKESLACAAFR